MLNENLKYRVVESRIVDGKRVVLSESKSKGFDLAYEIFKAVTKKALDDNTGDLNVELIHESYGGETVMRSFSSVIPEREPVFFD